MSTIVLLVLVIVLSISAKKVADKEYDILLLPVFILLAGGAAVSAAFLLYDIIQYVGNFIGYVWTGNEVYLIK